MKHNFLAILPLVLAGACSGELNSAKSLDTSVSSFTSQNLWEELQQRKPSAAAVAALGAKAPSAWYKSMLASTGNHRFTIDGNVFVNVHERLVENEAAFTALGERYANLKAYWDELGLAPQLNSEYSVFKSGIQAASAYATSTGPFAKSKQTNLNLDFELLEGPGTGAAPDNNYLPVRTGHKRTCPQANNPNWAQPYLTRGNLENPGIHAKNQNDVLNTQTKCLETYSNVLAAQGSKGAPYDDWVAATAGCARYALATIGECQNSSTPVISTE